MRFFNIKKEKLLRVEFFVSINEKNGAIIVWWEDEQIIYGI